jgi:hypothetical protein
MTISRLMLTTALIGTLALPALAQTHVSTLGTGHHAATLRHRVVKPTGPVHSIAAPGGTAGTTVGGPGTKPPATTAAPTAAARAN